MNKKGRVALITGGGTGIGAAAAIELASIGLKVAIVGRRPEPLDRVVKAIENKGGTAISFPADVKDYDSVEQFVNTTKERLGQIDLLVPNAAVHDVSNIVEGDPYWWRELVNINVVGVMNTIRAVLPDMVSRETGHIIVVSSVSGRVTYVGEASYIASKHATVAFTDCLRQEVSPLGIRVTIIEPGLVETPMLDDNPFAEDLMTKVKPLTPEDCARAIRYAYEQPDNCSINEIVIRPVKQVL